MNNQQALEVFHSAPVSKAVLKNALPAMAAMLMVLIYNLADTFFIGMTGDALQVAAVSLATPVFLMFMAVGTAFGVGGTSVISRALGEGRSDYAKKVSSFCMWACVLVGLVMSALFLLFMEQIVGMVGASDETGDFTRTYLTIVAFGGPFILISNCFSSIIRAEGRAKTAMMGQILGNLLNIILDPIMIIGFSWNIAGAAIATLIGNLIGAAYYIGYFVRGKSSLSIHIKDFTMKEKVCRNVLAIGIPAALGSLLISVSHIITNSQMAEYGDLAIAGMGVAMKVITIAGMVCIGIGQGVQPILGYCVGAGLWERFKGVLKFSLAFALALGSILVALCYLFAGQIVGAFLTDATAYDYAVQFARILLTSTWLFGVFCVLTNTLQAMGAVTASFVLNLSRQGIVFIPALFILKAAYGLTGLVWAQPVSDVISIMVAVVLLLRTLKKMMRSTASSLPPETGREDAKVYSH